MKRLLLPLLLLISLNCLGQIKGDLLFEGGFDVIKSDIQSAFNKAQFGAELGYFLSGELAISGGLELWSEESASLLIGARYALNDKIYLKGRVLLGADKISLGGGYSFFFSEKVRFNAGAEVYHTGELALRVSSMWTIRRNGDSN